MKKEKECDLDSSAEPNVASSAELFITAVAS
jgi:hypothetical protein